MGRPQRVRKLTPAEYLDIERAAAYRSEYFDGEMFAMAGGSPRHSLIKRQYHSRVGERVETAAMRGL